MVNSPQCLPLVRDSESTCVYDYRTPEVLKYTVVSIWNIIAIFSCYYKELTFLISYLYNYI